MRNLARAPCGLAAALALAWPAHPSGAPDGPGGGLERFTFHRAVANVEDAVVELTRQPPPSGRVPREAAGGAEIWHGRIMRRVPGEGRWESGHYVPFLAVYEDGVARRAWCDTNLNGDLTDDPEATLLLDRSDDRARSFLADLRWPARAASQDLQVDWKVRVVLRPAPGPGRAPSCSVQMVHAMVGSVTLQGKAHIAFLFDGNGDGLYTDAFGDGIYVDLDDDHHFVMDPMSAEFGPFAVPFSMGGRRYRIGSVHPEGLEISLADVGAAEAAGPVAAGREAPLFSSLDASGRDVRLADLRGKLVLLYFWASWCGASLGQAPRVSEIYERYHPSGLEILGVSYDLDRSAMERFRSDHGQVWPTTFSGRMLWEDPVGRLYRASGPGLAYLIDREGRLDGIYSDVEELAARLAELLPAAAARTDPRAAEDGARP